MRTFNKIYLWLRNLSIKKGSVKRIPKNEETENPLKDDFVFENLPGVLMPIVTTTIMHSFCDTIIVFRNSYSCELELKALIDLKENQGSKGGFEGELKRIKDLTEVQERISSNTQFDVFNIYLRSKLILKRDKVPYHNQCLGEGVTFWKFEDLKNLNNFRKRLLNDKSKMDFLIYSNLLPYTEKQSWNNFTPNQHDIYYTTQNIKTLFFITLALAAMFNLSAVVKAIKEIFQLFEFHK